MTANRELKELQAKQVREIAKERLQSAINSLQRAMYDLEVYLLLRPDEVSSRIADPAVLEIRNHALGVCVQHHHVFVGSFA